MRAVAYHGKRDVRVDTVPDPTIEEPTDAIVRITSTGICGSDLHLYEVLGAFMDEGDILGHEPMGIVEEVGSEVTQIKPGDRVVIPFNISCGHCFMCDQQLYSQCETTQVREQGKGAVAARLHQALRPGAGRPGRVPARARRRSSARSRFPKRPPDERFVYLSDVLPDRVAGGGVRGDTRRRHGRGVRARADRADVVPDRAAPRSVARCSGSTWCLSGWRWPAATASTRSTCASTTTSPGRCGCSPTVAGPDSVIDAVGMEAHGAPLGKLAQQLAGLLPDPVRGAR